MDRKDLAVKYYLEDKYHCSQAILLAFSELIGLDKQIALSISSNFGGGMKKGEMCGCITGGLMVLGMLYGHENRKDKKEVLFINKFKEMNSSYICKDLLKNIVNESRNEKCTIGKKGCSSLIESAVTILEGIINDRN